MQSYRSLYDCNEYTCRPSISATDSVKLLTAMATMVLINDIHRIDAW